MSLPNTQFAEPREREFDADTAADRGAGVEAMPSTLPPGAELLLAQLQQSLAGGLEALDAIERFKLARDKAALESAAARLVQALGPEPKMLARKLSVLIHGTRL